MSVSGWCSAGQHKQCRVSDTCDCTRCAHEGCPPPTHIDWTKTHPHLAEPITTRRRRRKQAPSGN